MVNGIKFNSPSLNEKFKGIWNGLMSSNFKYKCRENIQIFQGMKEKRIY